MDLQDSKGIFCYSLKKKRKPPKHVQIEWQERFSYIPKQECFVIPK